MPDATNPRDFVRVIGLTTTFAEVLVANPCMAIEVRQVPSETQQVIRVRHRSDTSPIEGIPSGGLFQKGRLGYRQGRQNEFAVGDTIGFFASSSVTPNIQVKEITV